MLPSKIAPLKGTDIATFGSVTDLASTLAPSVSKLIKPFL